jgi:anti-anti-sigma factor
VGKSLEVTTRWCDGVRVIAVAGEVDLASVERFQTHVDAAFRRGEPLLVVDLTQVTFVDSAMLHALFRALRRARLAGGDIAVVCVDPRICRLLEVFGLTPEVAIYGDASAAAAALNRPPHEQSTHRFP